MSENENKKYDMFEVWKHNKWTKLHRRVGVFLFAMAIFGAVTSLMGFQWPDHSFEFFFAIFYVWFCIETVLHFTLCELSFSLIIIKIIVVFIHIPILTFFMLGFLGIDVSQLLGSN